MRSWSPQQQDALAKCAAWLRIRHSPVFYLAGYAGTGKTTLAIEIARLVKGKVAFAAFTGKAARVMQSKGCAGARTIHSLIYSPVEQPDGEVKFQLRFRTELAEYSLIIIDECSMVNEEIGKDLLSFNVPVLVLGDPAQLPPVSGGGYFTSGTPDYMLTEVHRQAAESPIIWLATKIRNGELRFTNTNTDGLLITQRKYLAPDNVTGADIVLVGRNDTRQRYNARLRQIASRKKEVPESGEPVICLRNDRDAKIFNGDIFRVVGSRLSKATVNLTLDDPDSDRKPFKVRVRKEFFQNEAAASELAYSDLRGTQQFAYGYAITCHKSQGSQWGNVCVFDESSVFREDRARWLYTAATRAAEHLTLVI